MNLYDVAGEVLTRLDTIVGLRVAGWGDRAKMPVGLVALPETGIFDETYGRAADRYPDLPVCICLPNPTSRGVLAELSAYTAGSGPKSVKQVLDSTDADPYAACDTFRVKEWSISDETTYDGVPCLTVIFYCDVFGEGAA